MKTLFAAVALLLSLPAYATITWTSADNGLVSIASCTSTTESAPTLVTEGLSLAGVKGIVVVIETAGTLTAGGVLQAYIWNDSAGTPSWVRVPDHDLTVQALAKQAFSGFAVTSPRGRIAFIPSGVGLASTIYITATR